MFFVYTLHGHHFENWEEFESQKVGAWPRLDTIVLNRSNFVVTDQEYYRLHPHPLRIATHGYAHAKIGRDSVTGVERTACVEILGHGLDLHQCGSPWQASFWFRNVLHAYILS